ncbi:NAD(P)/FAD-dependent oxidoreductase [Neofamilia massiliensis]|uniref:NAD(P)/FAD-dependent oxidoreductase n=1 Tax=Neofamilia massiliensis TaxID=1673724 RepID=UPI0006BB8E84|nr:NAD(P)/FAD-dependent oxidoreductase [Neofamilia massiliensis]
MKIGIIGGGPAGMLLSVLIKKQKPDFEVNLYERNERVGKKLLATGNGRCNYTNVSLEANNFHSENSDFPMEVVSKFNNQDAIELLKTLGIYPISEADGRVFPLSLQGSSVLDFLRLAMERYEVNVILEEKIDRVRKVGESFVLEGKKNYKADKVVVATGGMALPSSGSDGIGYRIAKDFGHRIIEPGPTIVQLESDYKRIKALKGVRINTWASLYIDKKKIDEKFADVLFTDYGLSGPAIMDLSRKSIAALNQNKKVEISINLIGLPKDEVKQMIKDRAENLEGISFENFLLGIVNKKLIISVVNQYKLLYNRDYEEQIRCTTNFVNAMTEILTDFRMNISGYKGFAFAQATTGGVDTREIDPMSLESKKVKGLYFIGEVLDVDGDCGGYNLQWAWSSSYIAAKNILERGK